MSDASETIENPEETEAAALPAEQSEPVSPERAALNEAIAIAGGVTRLAELLGIASQAIHQWKSVPVARVLKIEEVTGVSRYRLRPDIYPHDSA